MQIDDVGLANFARNFAPHPDGKRVVVLKDATDAQSRITKATFIFNFPEEIRRNFPASQP